MPSRPRVALLIETSNSYGRDLLRGIQSWQREHGPWALRLVEQGRGADVPRWLQDWPGQGIIARVEHAAIAQALLETGLPVVDVSAALARPPFPQVVTDSRAVIKLACAHFFERGFERIAYVGVPGFRWSEQRSRYLAEELERVRLPLHAFDGTGGSPEADQAALARWLQQLPKPIGVLACYDVRGQHVLEACHLGGLRVPDEVAVLGVHNDRLVCELCDPPLSSVEPDARCAGALAAARLDALMRGDHDVAALTEVAPLGVVTRQSTDVVAVADSRLAAAVRYIRAHACEGVGVADVLRAVPMARTALERGFRSAFGCSPREMIERTRIERVKRWLLETDASVAEIAELTGFSHPEYMSVVFRRANGVAPREWRVARQRSREPAQYGRVENRA